MLSKFFEDAINEIAEKAADPKKEVTAAELASHLSTLFIDDPIIGFSALDGELYHQSGRVTQVPHVSAGIVMVDDFRPIKI